MEGSEGVLADTSAAFFLPLSRRFFLNASATLTWADARYTGAYFGVTPQQSSTALAAGGVQLPSFAASSGLRDIAFSLMGNLRIDRHWGIQALVGEATLLAAASKSPLTQQRVQLMAGSFLSYSF
jgi:outer membrane scaffolding protein for murein synthesis (MipA/OmpV family)